MVIFGEKSLCNSKRNLELKMKVENIINVTKANKAKRNDLHNLNEIFKKINELKDAEYPTIKQILIDIGELSDGKNGLSEDVFDANCIRNKYGYINRLIDEKNEKNKINKDGIYFEKLYHLSEILNDSPNFLNDSEILSKLKIDLVNLQKKIARILCDEKEFPTDDDQLVKQIHVLNENYDPDEHNMAYIIKICNECYDQIALKKINEEITTFENVDFSIRDDMYYFARKFTIIGEKLYEIIEDEIIHKEGAELIQKKEAETELNKFKFLYKIKYVLINLHKEDSESQDDIEEIKKNISTIKKYLLTIIKIDENKKFSLNYNDLKLLSARCTELYKILKFRRKQTDKATAKIDNIGKTASADSPSVTGPMKDLNKLKNDIINVYEHIQNHKELRKDIVSLDSKYQQNLKKLTQNLNHFPRNMDHFNNGINKLNPKLFEETESYNKNMKKLTKELETNNQKIMENIREEVNLLPKTLSINDDNEKKIIESAGKKLKEKREEDKKDKLKRIEQENKIKEQMKTLDKIMNISRKIDNEMKYLREIEPRIKKKENKEYYIMEHIMSLISQYCKNLEVVYEKSTKPDDKSIPSNINPEYNINSLNRGLYPKNDISNIYKIPLDTLLKIGSRFFILNWYNVAIKYFKQGKECIPDDFCLLNIEIDPQPQNSDDHIISLNECFSVSCSNLSHFYLLLVKLLAVCYIENKEWKQAFDLLEPIYKKVQSITKNNLRKEYYDYVSDIFYYTAKFFFDRQDYDQAAVLFKRSLELSNNLHRKIYVSIHYTVKKKPDIVKELLNSILNDTELDAIKKFYALKSYESLLRQIIEDQDELTSETNKILLEINRLSEVYRKEFEDFQTRLDLYAWSEKLRTICGKENKDNKRNSSVLPRKFEPHLA